MNIAARLPLAAMIALAATPSLASEDMTLQTSEAIFGFGGVLTKEDMLKSAALIPVEYERNAILGGGYQFYPYHIGNLKLGGEIGVAARFGKGFTGEVWAGPVARYEQIRLGERLFITPSFTAGLSLVTDAQRGREREQEIKDALKATTEEAVKRGAFGAPIMFVGEQMFFGQDRLDFVREALNA